MNKKEITKENMLEIGDLLVNTGQGRMVEYKLDRYDWSNFYNQFNLVFICEDGHEHYMLESNVLHNIERGMWMVNP